VFNQIFFPEKNVKASEAFYMAILFVIGFIITELMLDHVIMNAFWRFLFRITLMAQYCVLIYLFFEFKDRKRKQFEQNNTEIDDLPDKNEKGETDGK
jgi:hypothetical protein